MNDHHLRDSPGISDSRNRCSALFTKQVAAMGEFSLHPLDPDRHAPLLHDWVTREYARYWGMSECSVDEVREAYREIVQAEHSAAFLGCHDGHPAFLMEQYLPSGEPVGACYDVEPGDRGMHILVAPAERPIHGFTWQVFLFVMDFLFSDPATRRVVVEPDVRNDRIHALNQRAGFAYHRQIELPDKTAWLATCTRDAYCKAREQEYEAA